MKNREVAFYRREIWNVQFNFQLFQVTRYNGDCRRSRSRSRSCFLFGRHVINNAPKNGAQRCSEIPEEMKNSETAAAELRETAVSESEMTARTPGYNQDSEPFFEKFRDPKNSETSAVESSLSNGG